MILPTVSTCQTVSVLKSSASEYRDVNLVISDAKQLLPVFEEANEFLSNLELVCHSDRTFREPGVDGLLDPDHVCQFGPVKIVIF